MESNNNPVNNPIQNAPRGGAPLARSPLGVRALVYGALCVALAFALSYVKLFSMPMGGSVTLCSMLPILLYGYRFGVGPGLLCGLAYGLLQLLQKPEIVHWVQPLMDYPFAFGVLGLAGVFRKTKLPESVGLALGIVTGGALRLGFHVASGAVFFGAYAPAGMNPWWYSFLYNGGYLGVETLLCLLVALLPPVRRALKRI